MKVLRALRQRGVLGINRRNAEYTLRWNPRARYPTVEDKLLTKELCARAGIPTPKLLAVARHHFELRRLRLRWNGQPHLKRYVLSPPGRAAARLLGGAIDAVANLAPFAFSRLAAFWVGGFEEIEMSFVRPREG